MEIVLPPEIWGLGLVAAGFCGWVFGNFWGAASVRADGFVAAEQSGDQAGERSRAQAREQALDRPTATIFHSNSAGQNCEVFKGMPPLAEVRSQVRHILQTSNLWETPDAEDRLAECKPAADLGQAKLLRQYRKSIEELQRANDPSRSPPDHRPNRRLGQRGYRG